MNRYYIKDTTINTIVYRETVPEVVAYLETLCKKLTGQNRTNFMLEMVSLGHGYDDTNGAYFTELMADKVELGLVGKDGRFKRCNVHEHARNAKYRDVMGD
jgi:hypothetical protein